MCQVAGPCEDECVVEGATECAEDKVVTCAMGNGCLVWADVVRCSKGCQDGVCLGSELLAPQAVESEVVDIANPDRMLRCPGAICSLDGAITRALAGGTPQRLLLADGEYAVGVPLTGTISIQAQAWRHCRAEGR